ncbi:MAG: alpha-galactosidase [Clostridiales bacterium]|nr:alpha-galactosidase [Clostridiales bacterium]
MTETLKKYDLGDMSAEYICDSERRVGLMLYPKGSTPRFTDKRAALDSLVQIKLSGDAYAGGYGAGYTMRQSESTLKLRLVGQNAICRGGVTQIDTHLSDERGNCVTHTLLFHDGDRFVTVECTYKNGGDRPVTLEMFSSFSLTGISPYLPADSHGKIMLHRIMSRWSEEGRLRSDTMEELLLDTSWNMGGVRCERYGAVGSMPVNHYFPFIAVEDTENHVFWGAQLAVPSSWQMEVYRKDENIAVSGGLADREFGHWTKKIGVGESFSAPTAILSTANTDSIDIFSSRLTEYCERFLEDAPECEKSLPVMFNEYCTTWGIPSHDNITRILEKIKNHGISYFVIDCGWYKPDDASWWSSMGDYVPSKALFPDGMERTVDAIHAAGMKAGLWFEIDNVGPDSKAYRDTEHLLKLDGVPLTVGSRRFWDLKNPEVHEILKERVIGTLKRFGFDYLKIDYNENIGIGADGAESPGEALRQNMAASVDFIREIKREIPGIIIENCASGGHRLEPGFMSEVSMASFSDAHEQKEIPIIAADLHRVILPRQSQIWAVIRKSDDIKRLTYTMAATFLGRMCISGDVTELSPDKWAAIDAGIAFYKKIAPIVKRGQTYRPTPQIREIRHPEGYQCVFRMGDGRAYAVIHTFGGEIPEKIEVPLPKGCPEKIADFYSDGSSEAKIENEKLIFRPSGSFCGAGLYFE